jgi:pyruvate,orthophosphate dikinase
MAKATTKKPAAKSAAPKKSAPAATKSGKSTQYVYTWGNAKADGDGPMNALLGGRGANPAELTRNARPVPPGRTNTTEVCT